MSSSPSQITGDGTNTITINPTANFIAGNSYYINIDATALEDDAGNAFAGITDSTTFNFTAASCGTYIVLLGHNS